MRKSRLSNYKQDRLIEYFVLILFISATLFAHVVFAQNTISVELTEEEKAWIRNHPKVRATNGLDFAPFDFVHFGESTGFSIDYLNLVSEKTGLNIEYVNGYIWAELLRMVADKKIDITHTLVQSEERDKFLNFTDRWNGWLKDMLVMFGRVPFAFYVAHFYLIHALSVVVGVMQGFEAHQFIHFFILYPEGFGVNLFGVYGIWLLVVVILYPFCKWMADLKKRRKDWWLSYL